MTKTTLDGERMKICEACELYNKKFCKACGCFMPVKVRITSARCPKGKW